MKGALSVSEETAASSSRHPIRGIVPHKGTAEGSSVCLQRMSGSPCALSRPTNWKFRPVEDEIIDDDPNSRTKQNRDDSWWGPTLVTLTRWEEKGKLDQRILDVCGSRLSSESSQHEEGCTATYDVNLRQERDAVSARPRITSRALDARLHVQYCTMVRKQRQPRLLGDGEPPPPRSSPPPYRKSLLKQDPRRETISTLALSESWVASQH